MQTATPIPTQPTISKPLFRWKRLPLMFLGIIGLIVIGFVVLVLVIPTPGEVKIPAGYTRNESRYLTMRDGVRIATDVWYPADLAPNQKAPAIIRSTRYHRTDQVNLLGRAVLFLGLVPNPFTIEPQVFNQGGYVLVQVDARGSGASYGSRSIEWSPDEVADLGEVIDWIVSQPWSNGKVGAYGVSYDGNTAEVTAATQRSALKAVAPQYDDFDPQAHLAIPGGVFNQRFIQEWSSGNEGLDRNDLCFANGATGIQCLLANLFNIGVKPVDGDRGRRQRTAALAEHHNPNIFASLQGIEHRDDPFAESGLTLGEVSPYGLRTAIEGSGVAMYVWVGWLDAGTVNGALSRYLTFRNPQQLIIGPWSHGGEHHIDPFLPADTPTDPSSEHQQQMLLQFFDQFLKDQDAPAMTSKITYYVLGAGDWKTTNVWPPAGVRSQRWYFGADGLLSPTAPIGLKDADEYTVDFTATTGDANRWVTQLGGPDVVYPDRATEDKKLLTYTSEPLPTGVEITGSPVVTLYVSSTATDGAFFVYLEDVAPDGRVTYITEGILRAIHRKVSSEPPPYTMLGPYHSFLRADAAPLTPGEVATVPIQLYATAVLIHKDHRLRVSVAGHDASMFVRYPAEGVPVLSVQRNKVYASSIDLPVLAQP